MKYPVTRAIAVAGAITAFADLSGAATSTPIASGQAQSSYGSLGSQVLDTGDSPGEDCSCTATYFDGTTSTLDSCSRADCPDMEEYLACQNRQPGDPMPMHGCRLLESCSCHCWETAPRTGYDYGEDVLLAGATNLWQFDYGCGAFGTNAVGCGPVSTAMLLYWWAQQGYDGLVQGFSSGSGNSPSSEEHDWKALVKTLRDDYLDGGLCVDDQYATTQVKLRDGIEDYIRDSGYSAHVERLKVCVGCDRNEPDEIDSTRGLDFIKDELYAGRPVIMGFNLMRAFETRRTLVDDSGTSYDVFTGELSNGGAGFIDHYALVTGYREIDGNDVIFLNVGWEPDARGNPFVDQPFLWQPGGKWLHLYGIDITSPPDGRDWCVLDRGITSTFKNDSLLDASFDVVDDDGDGFADAPLSVLAGASCGVLRTVETYQYNHQWDEVFECDPLQRIENDMADALEHRPIGGSTTSTTGGDRGSVDAGGSLPPAEWIPPPGL